MAEVRDYTALVSDYFWNQPFGTSAPQAKPIFLTYSFPEQNFTPAQLEGVDLQDNWFRPFNEAEKQLFRESLQAWSAVSGVIFLEADGAFGDLQPLVFDLGPATAALAALPLPATFRENNEIRLYGEDDVEGGGKLYFDHRDGLQRSTFLHEIGHTLGLKHPFEGDPVLVEDLDNTANTIMSYTGLGQATGLGPLDVAAVRALYGTPDMKAAHVESWSWNEATNTLHQVVAGQRETSGTGAHDIIDLRAVDDAIVYTRGGNDVVYVDDQGFQMSGGSGVDTLHVEFARSAVQQQQVEEDHWYFTSEQGEVMRVFGMERIVFTDGLFASDTDGTAGIAYRIYQAAFARTPDKDGLLYWLGEMDRGRSLGEVAAGFVSSQEFKALYAAASVADYVEQLYRNILGRDGEAGGVSYWIGELESGRKNEAALLADFSESSENVAKVAQVIGDAIWLA